MSIEHLLQQLETKARKPNNYSLAMNECCVFDKGLHQTIQNSVDKDQQTHKNSWYTKNCLGLQFKVLMKF